MPVLLWKVLLPALRLTIFWIPWKKEQSATHALQYPSSDPKPFGVVADYPALVNKTPIIISAGFSVSRATTSSTTDTTVIAPKALPSGCSLAMPSVRSQGTENSCVAFAVTYTRACEQYYKTGAASYSDALNVFSPEYVFNQVRAGEDGAGSGVLSSLELIKNQGVCKWQSMPYSATNGWSVLPTPAQTAEAANYKITSYSRIINSDQTAIKAMLAAKHPVIASFTIDKSFYNAHPGFVWKSLTGNCGSHTMALCGYDDAKHAYKAINSWGTTWGDAGYIWIDYDLFPVTASYYTYVMTL